jgi:hypothetical protein
MTFGTTAGMLTASICFVAAPLVGWAAECTDRWCSCFGDDDCAALFQSDQCIDGTEVKSSTEMATLCSLETKTIVLGSCRQAPLRGNVTIWPDERKHVAAFPHLSKSCGG